MAHQLWPARDSAFLSPEEVVSRLQTAFATVRVDHQRASAEVEAGLAYMRRIAGPDQPFTAADVARKHHNRSRAVHVTIEERGVAVGTVVEVDEGLLFSYPGETAERDAAALVERVAVVLGYDCETV